MKPKEMYLNFVLALHTNKQVAATAVGFSFRYLKLKCKNCKNKYLHDQKCLQTWTHSYIVWEQQSLRTSNPVVGPELRKIRLLSDKRMQHNTNSCALLCVTKMEKKSLRCRKKRPKQCEPCIIIAQLINASS